MPPLSFVGPKTFKTRLKEEGSVPDNLGIRKQYIPDVIRQVGEEDSRALEFIISTGSVDRQYDTINPKGWDVKAFRKNPVVLFAHDASRPPIGKASSITKSEEGLSAVAEFMDNEIDTSGFSDMIFRMLKGGFLNATSVGFQPKEWSWVEEEDDEDRFRRMGIDFNKQELLEFSIVPVPANAECLIQARSAGIDTLPLHEWFDEALQEWADYKEILLIPRKTVEDFAKAAEGNKSSKVYRLSKEEQQSLLQRNLENIKAQEEAEETVKSAPDDEISPESVQNSEIEAETKQDLPESAPESEDSEVEKEVESVETEEVEEVETQPEQEEQKVETAPKSTEPRKLKLISNGLPQGTRVVLADTGEVVAGVQSAMIFASYDGLTKAKLTLTCVDCEFVLPENSEIDIEDETNKSEEEVESVEVTDVDESIDDGIDLDDLFESNDEVETQPDEKVENLEEEREEDTPEDELELSFTEDDVQEIVTELLPDLIRSAISEEINKITGKVS